MHRMTERLLRVKTFQSDPLVVVDVGAAGGFERLWADFDRTQIRLYGFEPNMDGEVITHNGFEVTKPFALGNVHGLQTFYEGVHAHSSSLKAPDDEALRRYPWGHTVNVKRERLVSVEPLDDLIMSGEVLPPDYVKLDCEGGEYDALVGMAFSLPHVLGVNIEVMIETVRKGQGAWWKLAQVLEDAGLTLYHVKGYRHMRSALSLNPYPENRGRTVWAQMQFMRDATREFPHRAWAPRRVLKMACLLEMAGFPDCAIDMLQQACVHGYIDQATIEPLLDLLTPLVDGKKVTYPEYMRMMKEACGDFEGRDMARSYHDNWHGRI